LINRLETGIFVFPCVASPIQRLQVVWDWEWPGSCTSSRSAQVNSFKLQLAN